MSELGSAARFMSVLAEDLLALPDRLAFGQAVPVAYWIGINYCAVTVVEEGNGEPGPSPQRYLATTYAYRFGEHGWEQPQTLGGMEWAGGPFARANLGDYEVVLEAGWSGSPGGWSCRRVQGFAGAEGVWLELSEGATTTIHAIGPSGVFVAVVDGDGPGTVHVLDRAGQPIKTYQFTAAPRPPDPADRPAYGSPLSSSEFR